MPPVTPTHCMHQALVLARRGQGWVEPNPMVGAVLVREGRVVARGYHRRFGGAHAEIELLRACQQSGVTAAGGDLYVTLEPCCHHGKTPPCVDAIIDAGIGRVSVATADPNPLVAGRGIERLRQAGIPVEVGLCEQEARTLNEPYLKKMIQGLPWVIAKFAQTLDGRIATAQGDSRWISNTQSRRLVHRLRARVDAVVVGIGTVLGDDPVLTARGVGVRRVARRVVVDPQLRLPMGARLLEPIVPGEQAAAPLTLAVSEQAYQARHEKAAALESNGVGCVVLPAHDAHPGKLALRPLLEHLVTQHAATNVLVEGGSKLIGSLLDAGLVDQVLAFVAPKLMGDAAGVPAVQGLACPSIADCRQLCLKRLKRLGDDVLLDYRVT